MALLAEVAALQTAHARLTGDVATVDAAMRAADDSVSELEASVLPAWQVGGAPRNATPRGDRRSIDAI